jgi:hypothetical protein
MIHDVDESLRNLIRRDALAGTDVEVVLDAPTRDWSSRRNAATLDLYLYDIRENIRWREQGLIDVRNEQGRITARRQPARFYKLSYLVTAWTQRPEDEHRLLDAVLACLLRHDRLPEDALAGELTGSKVPIPVTVALPPPEDRALSDVWSALGGDLKPSLDVVVTCPFAAGTVDAAAPEVREPLRLGVGIDGRRIRGPATSTPEIAAVGSGRVTETVIGGSPDEQGRIFRWHNLNEDGAPGEQEPGGAGE